MAVISNADKKYLLSLTPDDLTFSKLVELFGNTVKQGENISKPHHSKFETTDELILTPSEYFVKNSINTTVGRFIYNKYLIERCGFQDVLGYVNDVLTDGGNKKIEGELSQALIDEKITIEQFVKYIDYRDTLGMQLHSVIATSFTPATIKTPPEVQKKKLELFKKYDKELNEGDIVTSEKIEKELTSMAKSTLKGDPGLDLYDSAARGNFGNYKNMNLFKGATMNTQEGKYEIVRSSFMDGIQKEDIPSFGTSVVSGAYPKAVGTQESGYLAKQLLASMQTETLDAHGTDCGSKKTIEIVLTDKNFKDYQYRYISENGKLICLTPEVKSKYIGKTVHLRTPMYCLGDKICNICGGEMNYRLDTLNVGLGCSKVANTLLRLGMKKFHTSNLASKQIDVNDLLI